MAAQGANVSQLAGLALAATVPQPMLSQTVGLVVSTPPFSKGINISQAAGLAVSQVPAEPLVSGLVGLVVVREGLIDSFVNTAWTFDFDGHSFYVLQLGPVGTFVYDFTSKTWSQWRTSNLLLWNMFNGIRWNGINVAVDLEFPVVFEIKGSLQSDEGFRPITRIVTGALPVIGRDFLGCDVVYLEASVGDPTEFPTTVDLKFSDDQGNTFSDVFSIELEESNTSQQLSWRSLGQMRSPARIFEFTDVGGLVRISSLDVITNGEENG